MCKNARLNWLVACAGFAGLAAGAAASDPVNTGATRGQSPVVTTDANGAMIGAMLNEFLRGATTSGQLWNTIEQQHRRRPIEANPDFGSGGFNRPSGGFWQLPIPAPNGPGRSAGVPPPRAGAPTSGGGGFRTGGGF